MKVKQDNSGVFNQKEPFFQNLGTSPTFCIKVSYWSNTHLRTATACIVLIQESKYIFLFHVIWIFKAL